MRSSYPALRKHESVWPGRSIIAAAYNNEGCNMEQDFTLPTLQSVLDELAEGKQLALARKQVDTLFGLSDVGVARLLRFASGHSCIIAHANDCIVFEKISRGQNPNNAS
jgi:hypothetical protein